MKTVRFMRFGAVIALACLLFPCIFITYLGLSSEPSIQGIGEALIGTVPLGEVIYSIILSFRESPQIGVASLEQLFQSVQFSPQEYMVLELAQVFLISVFMMAFEALLEVWLTGCDTTILTRITNLICKILFVFTASLLTDLIYDFVLAQVSHLPGVAQNAMIFTIALISFIGGVVAIFVAGGFFRLFLKCSLKILEVIMTYLFCILLTLSLTPWYFTLLPWIGFMVACEILDRLI